MYWHYLRTGVGGYYLHTEVGQYYLRTEVCEYYPRLQLPTDSTAIEKLPTLRLPPTDFCQNHKLLIHFKLTNLFFRENKGLPILGPLHNQLWLTCKPSCVVNIKPTSFVLVMDDAKEALMNESEIV